MTTYVYETIPQTPNAKPKRFEVRQSMQDAALTTHPETGEPIRRVIAGGYGFLAQKSSPPLSRAALNAVVSAPTEAVRSLSFS